MSQSQRELVNVLTRLVQLVTDGLLRISRLSRIAVDQHQNQRLG